MKVRKREISTNGKGNKKNKDVKTRKTSKSKKKVTVVRNSVMQVKCVNGQIVKQIKRKCYTPEAVQNAIKAVAEGMSLRIASATFGVPFATISRKLKNPESIGKKGGPSTVLTAEEEKFIITWIVYRAETGSPVTKSELFDCVQTYLSKEEKDTCFKNNRPGKKWYANFRKRHPDISLRVSQNLPLVRAAVTEENLRQWFEEVEVHLNKKGLKDIEASRVFNCDETNIQLHPKAEKVLVEKGARTVYKVIDAPERENATVLFMYSADGTRAPPMVLYTYKELPKKVIENVPQEWGVGLSDTGWMNTETFYEYMTRVFYPWLVKSKVQFPVVVYMDGHASHVTLPLVKFCNEKQIEIISLYAHSTHITQPLDIAFFHPLKDVYNKKAVPQWKKENNNKRLKKEDFPKIVHMALKLFSEEKKVIVNGFKASGLYPFNPDNVDYNVLKKKKKSKTNQSVQADTTEEQSENNSEVADQDLKNFEKNLPASLLDSFKSCEESQVWLGSIENKGLFSYWLMLKKQIPGTLLLQDSENVEINTESFRQLPLIKSVETVSFNLHNLHRNDDHEQSILLTEVDLEATAESLLETTAEETKEITPVEQEDVPIELLDQEQCCTVEPVFAVPIQLSQTMLNDSVVGHESAAVTEQESLTLLGNSYSKESVVMVVSPKEYLLPADDASVTTAIATLDIQTINEDSSSNISQPIIQPDTTDNGSLLTSIDTSPQYSPASVQETTQAPLQDRTNTIDQPYNAKEKDLKVVQEKKELQDNTTQQKETLLESFTLPFEYLPASKKTKLATKGKKKLPAVGTSEEWLKIHQEKEQQQKAKEEKLKKKKELQEQKKKLAEERKRLQEEMKLLQKKIKLEAV